MKPVARNVGLVNSQLQQMRLVRAIVFRARLVSMPLQVLLHVPTARQGSSLYSKVRQAARSVELCGIREKRMATGELDMMTNGEEAEA